MTMMPSNWQIDRTNAALDSDERRCLVQRKADGRLKSGRQPYACFDPTFGCSCVTSALRDGIFYIVSLLGFCSNITWISTHSWEFRAIFASGAHKMANTLPSQDPVASEAASAQTSSPKRKRFVPLENNPDVMNSLVHNLGLSQSLAFQDVFSIDDPELLEFVPRPAHALLLIFPVSEVYEKARFDEDKSISVYDGAGEDERVLWFRQTIGNACGLIGLLHAVGNGEGRASVGML
jgi:Ubiquitin carboxyl-terminal hydrolase, family 1